MPKPEGKPEVQRLRKIGDRQTQKVIDKDGNEKEIVSKVTGVTGKPAEIAKPAAPEK